MTPQNGGHVRIALGGKYLDEVRIPQARWDVPGSVSYLSSPALYLAANQLRKVDPQFAQRYYRLVVDEGKHHNSALCHLAANLATRIAACWRRRERYVLADTDGRPITQAEGRAIVERRFKVGDDVRRARRHSSQAKQLKQRTGRRGKESTGAAPAAGPSTNNATEAA